MSYQHQGYQQQAQHMQPGHGGGAEAWHIGHRIDDQQDPAHHAYCLMRACTELQSHGSNKAEEEHDSDPEVHDALTRIQGHLQYLQQHDPNVPEIHEMLQEVENALNGHAMGNPNGGQGQYPEGEEYGAGQEEGQEQEGAGEGEESGEQQY